MDFLTPIFENVKLIWEYLKWFYVIDEFEFGVVLRWGKFHKVVNCGFHWKWCFSDMVIVTHNTITTLETKPQTLTTKDDESIVISSIVKYKIDNPKIFLLEVNDVIDAINDITHREIKKIVINKTWLELRELKDEEIKNNVFKEAKKFGIKIYYITVSTLAKIRTIRLMR